MHKENLIMSKPTTDVKSLSELLNDKLVSSFIESTTKNRLDARAKMFLTKIVDDKTTNQLSGIQKEELVNEIMAMFSGMSNAITKQTIDSVRPTLFEKTLIDTIQFIDLPFLDEADVEQSRKDLLNNVIHTDLQFAEDTLSVLSTMFASSIVLGWNQLKSSIPAGEPITVYNLISAVTEVFNKEAFDSTASHEEETTA